MAQAGFYHCNIKDDPDCVQCFVCFKTLNGWEINDDPFEEHLSHSQNCSFAQLKTTQEEMMLGDWIKIVMERNANLHVCITK